MRDARTTARQVFLASLAAFREIPLAGRDRKRGGEADRGCGLPVHTSLGPGLLESAYEAALAFELETRGLHVARQQPVPILYQGTRIEVGFRADLIVAGLVIVELKSVETVAPVHKKQLLTYLRLGGKRLGLLINFNVALIKDGITRIANGMPE
ncbi:MAG TPA: GxxExxY protein [Bryobacteraceae bacterium]|nr:GxxExxY protein [Bryobacteraceae bacterium]